VTTGTGSTIDSNDIVDATEYSDPSTGAASSEQEETDTVDALGDTLTSTDRNGNVHTYTYDTLDRLTVDAVTTLGEGVDGSIRRIEYAYNDASNNPYLITSYNAASGGSIVNQVQNVYNGLGWGLSGASFTRPFSSGFQPGNREPALMSQC
jgi:YD repeat-containing protein